MNLFEFKENKVSVTPEALFIPEFAAVWDRDTSSRKEYALRELAYVYFLCDYNSVYQAYPEDVREEKIRKDLSDGTRRIKLSMYCESAVKRYKELQNTPTMEFLESVKKAMDKMTGYFNSVDFKERDLKGVPIYKPEIVTRCAKEAGSIVDSIDKLKKKVKLEVYESNLARGKASINHFEE